MRLTPSTTLIYLTSKIFVYVRKSKIKISMLQAYITGIVYNVHSLSDIQLKVIRISIKTRKANTKLNVSYDYNVNITK